MTAVSPGVLPRRKIFAVLAVALLAASPTLTQYEPVRRQLLAVGLLPRETPVTELSFAKHAALASTVTTAGDVQFRFVLRNVSKDARRFSWQVFAGSPDSEVRIKNGEATLAELGTVEPSVAFRLADCTARNRVRVEVTPAGGDSQSIHYWVLPAREKQEGVASCGR